MPEEPTATELKSVLWVDKLGQISFKSFHFSSGNQERRVEVFDEKKRETIWSGSYQEFWDLIMAGKESLRILNAPYICPKCGCTEGAHNPLCPIAQLAKKE